MGYVMLAFILRRIMKTHNKRMQSDKVPATREF